MMLPLDLIDPWVDGNFLEGIRQSLTYGPYMTEVLLLSMIWLALGTAMYIQTESATVPFILTIVFAGVIAATVGGTVANFIVVAMVIIIPGVLLLLLMRGDN